ncbi:MAG TPA: enoyl-CoA hydratase-related protein [Steroidobacteraceae bacterium]|nr:enoyl-CoA hydratase-related protein [Steroidobacteraceae bacterium]
MNEIKFERAPPLAWVTFNRPAQHNAISSAMWQELARLAASIAADAAIRVTLIRGAGTDAFSAGADIGEMQRSLTDPAAMRAMQAAVQIGQRDWSQMPQPTIAVIDGVCAGGGCGIALACDLRLATPRSYFMIPPAKLGLVYSLADTLRLVAVVGPARANELLFTGRRVAADEALAVGLINAVVPADDLLARATSLALDIAGNAQTSVRAAKQIVDLISAGEHRETPVSHKLYDDAFSSADFREGARAFLAKRPPRFSD